MLYGFLDNLFLDYIPGNLLSILLGHQSRNILLTLFTLLNYLGLAFFQAAVILNFGFIGYFPGIFDLFLSQDRQQFFLLPNPDNIAGSDYIAFQVGIAKLKIGYAYALVESYGPERIAFLNFVTLPTLDCREE